MAIPVALRRSFVVIALLALVMLAGLLVNGRLTAGIESVSAVTGPCGAGTAFFGSAPTDTRFVEGDTWQGGTFTNIDSDPDRMNARIVATGDQVGRFPSTSGGATATIVFAEPIMVTGILWYDNDPKVGEAGWSLNGIAGPITANQGAQCTSPSLVTDTIVIWTDDSGGIDFWFQAVPNGEVGGEGCTPGFWKNHLDAWVATGFSPSQTVASVFPNAQFFGSNTLLQALAGGGGSGLQGGTKILLRAGVASLLNASHPDVDFDVSAADVIADVNAALASGSRSTMIALAAELDASNNEGCPL